jgi:putative tryptophan/tyrosine transport system substrate-binding protein
VRTCREGTDGPRTSGQGASGVRMMRRRNLVVAIGAGTMAASLSAHGQQPTKSPARIGVLAGGSPETTGVLLEPFWRRMRKLGYVEGKSVSYEVRWAHGRFDRFPALARELVALQVDVIFATSPQAAMAARSATSSIPIVFTGISDPVAAGLAESLARPGGNATGVAVLAADTAPKHVELLRTVVPKLSRVALLLNPTEPLATATAGRFAETARAVGIEVLVVEASTPGEIDAAFARMSRERAGAAFLNSFLSFIERHRVAESAIKHRIPTTAVAREFVEAGCLMSYGANTAERLEYLTTYVDKILRGTQPADMPIEQATKLHLAINLKAAKALGIAVPPSWRLRADEVIE